MEDRKLTSFVVWVSGLPDPHTVIAGSVLELASHIPRLAGKDGKATSVRLGDAFQVKVGLVSRPFNVCHSTANIGKSEQVDFVAVWS